MNNNSDQNNNQFYNNGNPQQWGNQPQQPYYNDSRVRTPEAVRKSPVIPILVTIIVLLLVAICLIGGYLFGKSKNKTDNNEPMLSAELQTTVAETEAPVTEQPTEAAIVGQTENVTTAPPETTTAEVQTSVVVSVEVVKEPAKTIFVGSYLCDMRVATKSTDLNMRSSPSTSASIIGSIPKDTIVGYYGSEGSWGIVYYGGKYGYVNTAYLSSDLYPSHDVYQGLSVSYAVVKANGGLNLRNSDSTSASIITTIPNGTEVVVHSSYDGWSYVNYGDKYGYVKSEYLTFK
ncbi:MAG: Bacterial SH3 domain protein [Firmicutes bacterium ADurb.BinA205]|nr:MAG: Bacterial SH3 domain protein [Firmicutes bacterium ADurb.BinA205]